MNFLDIIIALPLIYGLYKGFNRGFIMEVFILLALVIGLYIAFHFSNSISANFIDYSIHEKSYFPSLVFLIVFLGVGLGIYSIGKVLEKMIKIALLSLPNKLAGMTLGFLKFLYITGSILLIISSFPGTKKLLPEGTLNNSFLFPIVTDFVSYTIPGVTSTHIYNYHKNNEN